MTGVAQLAGIGALLLSIALLCVRRIDAAIQLCAAQALLVAGALAPSGWRHATAAIAAFALNGVALPLMAHRVPATPALRSSSRPAEWAGALVLVLAPLLMFTTIWPSGAEGAVIPGSSIVLLGLLLVARSAHPLAPVLGLLSSQNGIVLMAGAGADLPLSALLMVSVPLLPALAVANAWLRR